jgi:hypothetical protein
VAGEQYDNCKAVFNMHVCCQAAGVPAQWRMVSARRVPGLSFQVESTAVQVRCLTPSKVEMELALFIQCRGPAAFLAQVTRLGTLCCDSKMHCITGVLPCCYAL